MRLDKYLSHCDVGTRKEVKKMIQKGLVQVNGQLIKDCGFLVDEADMIMCEHEILNYQQYVYYMLHKPAGCVCASKDNLHQTIFSYIPMNQKQDLFSVGRLDLDTEGLLLITNDGELSHELLSPRHHVDKTYLVHVNIPLQEEHVIHFLQGVDIQEKHLTKPAKLQIISSDAESVAYITISEGKYHQIKRMFHAIGGEVTYLKRITMGKFTLDPDLEIGCYRSLNEGELEYVKQYKSGNL